MTTFKDSKADVLSNVYVSMQVESLSDSERDEKHPVALAGLIIWNTTSQNYQGGNGSVWLDITPSV